MSKGLDHTSVRCGMASSTAAFHTLDPVDSIVFETMLRLLANEGPERPWEALFSAHPNLRERIDQNDSEMLSSLDDATLLFLLSMQRQDDGSRLDVAEGRHVERFGRFPSEDGCVLTYLLAWMRATQGHEAEHDKLDALLRQLAHGLDIEHQQASAGAGGLRLHGWLSSEDVKDLRTMLMGRCWTVAAEEPLDGGMRDGVTHLTALLRGAERRGVGLLHRSHA